MKKIKTHKHFILNINIEFKCKQCGKINKKQVLCRLKNQTAIPAHIITGVNNTDWQCDSCGTGNHAKRVTYGPLQSS